MDQQQQQGAANPQAQSPQGDGGSGGFFAILTVLLSFIAIFFMVLVPSSSTDSTLKNSLTIIHQVPEGHVGVYWRGGALLNTITDPGFHVKMPLITHFEPIQVTLQTDLIDEKMKDALQADCTRYAPGIQIISVRVTKPTIPDSIRRNFEQMEEERTKVLIAMERQRVAEKEAETQKKIAISEAQKNAQVSMIQMEQKLMEKDSARKQEEISNEMYKAREKSLADASFYRSLKEAEANKLKLTPQYLELKFIESITNNSKIFFGSKIPNMVIDQRLLGNFLQDITRKTNLEA
ncbi:SPFH/Band 7/PHB domain-containing membrane-associated protein family [Actinidia rufa]|uniref:SPFH/Band 7/PHB domain-containing membrane-associated protein family n=1 Tax=Actinidia rufa TaxID=165716 RepID=A0A7J0GJB4_9ERIC|nr:SPFH/Band 7/PHB domain-containing membrane-associated protein family [Actinidia rufa]